MTSQVTHAGDVKYAPCIVNVKEDCKPGDMVISSNKLQAQIDLLATEILQNYAGKKLTLIGLLQGAFLFTPDLAKRLHGKIELEIGYIKAKSYSGTQSGELRIVQDTDLDLAGRNVLLLDEVIDTGQTLFLLKKELERRGAEVKTCALVDKRGGRSATYKEVNSDFIGFILPPPFAPWLQGYGMDWVVDGKEIGRSWQDIRIGPVNNEGDLEKYQ